MSPEARSFLGAEQSMEAEKAKWSLKSERSQKRRDSSKPNNPCNSDLLSPLKPEFRTVPLNAEPPTDSFSEPPPRKGGGKVEDVDGMISKLKELGAI